MIDGNFGDEHVQRFEKFRSIPRLNKEVTVTEKLDGTNAQVHIVPTFEWLDMDLPGEYALATDTDDQHYMLAGSRKRYLTLEDDNFGFARWVHENNDELFKFGPGRHYGEWWGKGIQRTYGLDEKRLSMFNPKWADQGPQCVSVVPFISSSTGFDSEMVANAMDTLQHYGSVAAPGYMEPEGVVIFHVAANQLFKQTFDYDEGKWSEHEDTRDS